MTATTPTNGTAPALPAGIFGLYGRPGTLKTSHAYGFPKPILMFDFDLGAERGWQHDKLVASKDLTVVRMILPTVGQTERWQKLSGYRELWASFWQQYSTALIEDKYKTIVIDTATLEWNACCDAYLQELQEAQPANAELRRRLQQIEYGEPNARQRELLYRAKVHRKNLVLLMHETDERKPQIVGGLPVFDRNGDQVSILTGNKQPDGFRHTLGLSDWMLHTDIVPMNDAKTPVATVEKSAAGVELIGMRLEVGLRESLYQQLAKTVYAIRMLREEVSNATPAGS